MGKQSNNEKPYKVKDHQLFSSTIRLWKHLKDENEISPSKKNLSRKIYLVILLLSPFRLLQRLILKKRLKNFDLTNKSPVFVIGHWRSGTTHLHYLLSKDPQFTFIGSFQAFFFNIAFSTKSFFRPLARLLMPEKRPQDNVKIGVDLPQEDEHAFVNLTHMSGMHLFFFPKNRTYLDKYICFDGTNEEEIVNWKKIFHNMMNQISLFGDRDKRLLLKNPHSTGRIKILKELYPEAKFIFIHRNPYDVFNSTRTLYNKTIRSQFLQDFTDEELNDLIIYSYKKIIRTYLDQRALLSKGQIYEVAYKDLLDKPLSSLEEIYSTLNLGDFENVKPNMKEYLNSISNYKPNASKTIKPELLEKINKEWKFAFEEFNYEITND